MSVIKDFNRKLILITGGSSGIGYALAERFVYFGADVAILARRKDQLTKARNNLIKNTRRYHQKISVISADVSNKEDLYKALYEFERSQGVPDYIINSAGIIEPGLFDQIDVDVFDEIMAVNYLGTVYPTKYFLKSMIQRGSGYIINISSMAGLMIYRYSTYTPTKLHKGFSDVIRAELSPMELMSQLYSLRYPNPVGIQKKEGPGNKALLNAGIAHPRWQTQSWAYKEYLIIPGGAK